MLVHCDKESQSCISQLKCHSKCLCFDQVLHICLLKKKKKNAANNALCSPPVVGKRRKTGDSESNCGTQQTNQLFTPERQMACFQHEMSMFYVGKMKSVG